MDTIKLLEENTGRTLFDINHNNVFLDPQPRVMYIKKEKKLNKWDLIKLKTCGTVKETINKMKRQPMNWEKILAYAATNNRLISET